METLRSEEITEEKMKIRVKKSSKEDEEKKNDEDNRKEVAISIDASRIRLCIKN